MLLGGVTFSSTFMMSRSSRQSSGLRLVGRTPAVSTVQRQLMKIACGRARAVDGSDARDDVEGFPKKFAKFVENDEIALRLRTR